VKKLLRIGLPLLIAITCVVPCSLLDNCLAKEQQAEHSSGSRDCDCNCAPMCICAHVNSTAENPGQLPFNAPEQIKTDFSEYIPAKLITTFPLTDHQPPQFQIS
jgi:hypothetical protein